MRTTLLAICFLFASCSGKPDHPRVRIATASTGLQIQNMPTTLAYALGYYKEEGLDVALENLSSNTKTLQALIGGSVDAAGIVYSQSIQIAAEGQRVRTFFILNRRVTNVLVVAPAATGRIRRAKDLKGALIGVPAHGSPNQLWLNYYLAAHGVLPSEFRTVGIGLGASAFAAIESGRINAASVSGGDHLHLLRRHPAMRILADASTPGGMLETYGDSAFAGNALSAKQEWLVRNPDTARRLARALKRTLRWIASHTPEEIRERLPESFRSQDKEMDLAVIRWGCAMYTADGAMPKGAPEAMKRYLDATVDNVRNAKIDLGATWTNEFLPEAK